jgi:hypothetical protein
MGAIPAKIALLYFLFCHLRHLLIAERKHHFVIHPARPV